MGAAEACGRVAGPRGARALLLGGWAPARRAAPDCPVWERVRSTPPARPRRSHPRSPCRATNVSCRAQHCVANDLDAGAAGAASPRTLCGGGEEVGRGAAMSCGARGFLLCQALRFLEKKSVQRFQASVAAAAL